MGNTLQEILQGRGDEKGKGSWLKGLFPALLLFLTYLGLLARFPKDERRLLWFLFASATVALYGIFSLVKKERNYSVEFFLSCALLIAGCSQAFTLPWLRMGYFPFLLGIAVLCERRTVLLVLLFIPFLEVANFLEGTPLPEQGALIVFLAATVILALFLKRSIERRGRHVSPAERHAVDAVYPAADEGALSDSAVTSHYVELTFRPDEEIRDLLVVAKNAIFADAVNLFISSGGGLRLRCSSEEGAGIIPSTGGLLQRCLEQKQSFLSSDMDEDGQDAGYLKKDKIRSLILVPIMEGNFPLGVMTADSARVHAFSTAGTETLQMFSKQITRTLERERVFPQVQRSLSTMKILNEESARLLSSLDENVIVQSLIEGTYRIVPTETMFFTVRGRDVEILHGKDLSPRGESVFSAQGTVLDMAARNKRPVYISDVKDYRSPIMPFKMDKVNSVFLLPMFYERNLLGILALLLEGKNTLSSSQRDLIEVLGNQASISIANARFHAEIERMAVTDGLTGLFNHKQFQERLAQEMNRLGRFSEPLSLLLIDIDFFKKINDTHGHPVGDSVLKRVAEMIKKTIRNIDIPARYGGEEFAVVLVGTDGKGALNMAERMRKIVMDAKFTADQNTFGVTVSIGVSTYEGEGMRKEDLVERADKALYKAKGNGRNQSVLWSGNEGN